MTTVIVATVVLVLANTSATLQPAPDFSGQWSVEAASAAPPVTTPGKPPVPARGDMGSGWGPILTITQDAKRLVVEYVVFSRYDLQPPLRLVYALDGSETVNAVMLSHTTQERRSRTAWLNQTLEITTQYPGIHPESGKAFTTEVVQRLRLESPDLLVVEVTRATAGAPPSSTRTVYRRNAPPA
jgi:hypothetical protein